MTAASSAEEIADDFRHSLEYLQSPDRYAINNFTVIAKENTEHADAISNVLVEHINKAPPHHKLPALYVLDSIAKNIGTPYTLFLGHKLYNAFLTAYSAVDSNTRKKLDEMLKTWKSPVPGSLDPTPVFPLEYTRKIENALIQARTAFLKKHEQSQSQSVVPKRSGSTLATAQWRDTPTPPQQVAQYIPPGPQPYYPSNANLISQPSQSHTLGVENPLGQLGQPVFMHQPSGSYGYATASNPTYVHSYNQSYGPLALGSLPSGTRTQRLDSPNQNVSQMPGTDLISLQRDIDRLILSCSADPRSMSAQAQQMSKLDALKALKTLLSTQTLPFDQLAVVRRQVDELQHHEPKDTFDQLSSSTLPNPSGPVSASLVQSSLLKNPSLSNYSVNGMTAPATDGLLKVQRSVDLAALLAQASGEPSQPNPSAQQPTSRSDSLPRTSPTMISSMLASLVAKGVISQPSMSEGAGQNGPAILGLSTSVADLLARATGSRAEESANLLLMSASLKAPRPEYLKAMIERRPNQCVNCGLRFASSEDGKLRKQQHMDWHFKSNQRIADVSRGIQSRSWLVGETEWIKSKETEEQSNADPAGQLGASNLDLSHSKAAYVSVPTDPEAHQPCPICQERFDTGFNQDIQDWVWLDATQVASRIYHASCYADLRRDGHSTQERTTTPDSILGKRKAVSNTSNASPSKKLLVG